jgi:hypothetical protein
MKVRAVLIDLKTDGEAFLEYLKERNPKSDEEAMRK